MIDIGILEVVNVGSNVATAFVAGMAYMKIKHHERRIERLDNHLKEVVHDA
jgi:hypothetical protein